MKIPEDVVIQAANVGVELGTREDGTPNLILRITDHSTGEIHWVSIGHPDEARGFAGLLLARAEQLEDALADRG